MRNANCLGLHGKENYKICNFPENCALLWSAYDEEQLSSCNYSEETETLNG